MPHSHYENFPVASVLLPRHLRKPVRAIYAFARGADDLADEGHATPAQRLADLQAYEDELDRIEQGLAPQTSLFRTLAPVVAERALPLKKLRDLLSAFRQDVSQTRWASYELLLDYCSRSANPVGRIMLHLFGEEHAQSLAESDAICSALQLINFWQDVAIDWHKARVYLPQDEMLAFGVTEAQIAAAHVDEHWRALMSMQVERARKLMQSGAPLACRMPGRFGWELRLIVLGGLRILEKIEAVDYDVFRQRPRLNKADWLILLWRAVRFVG
jgi:squalene synthase HpnC